MLQVEEVKEHIENAVGFLNQLGLETEEFRSDCDKAVEEFVKAEAEKDESSDDKPGDSTELLYNEIYGIENRAAKRYIGGKLEVIEQKNEAAARSAFSQVTKADQIAECCYKRATDTLFNKPKKPGEFSFSFNKRKKDGLDIFVELTTYLSGENDMMNAQDSRCWPIISKCLEQHGRMAWGRGPQQAWKGGGRSAAEGQKTSESKSSGRGR